MKRVVLDAAGFLAWFGDGRGRGLRAEYEAGTLEVHVPAGFALDVLDVAQRDRALQQDAAEQLAAEVDRVGFIAHTVRPRAAAPLVARGLSGRQAAYAALAAELDVPLASGDADLVGRTPTARDIGEA